MRDWLIIITVIAVVWMLWLFFNFVADLIERAARRGEDISPDKETESF